MLIAALRSATSAFLAVTISWRASGRSAIGGIVAALIAPVALAQESSAQPEPPAAVESAAGGLLSLLLLLGLTAVAWFAAAKLHAFTLRPQLEPRPRPRGLADRPDPLPKPDASLLALAGAFTVFLIASLAVAPAGLLLGEADAQAQPLRAAGLPGLFYYPAGIVAGVVALVLCRTDHRRPRPADLAIGLLAFVLAAPVIMLIGRLGAVALELLGHGSDAALQHGTLDLLTDPGATHSPWFWAVVAGAVLGAPVFEELLFRGLLQPACAGIARSRWLGILISSAVFVALHVPTGEASTGATLAAIPTIAALSIALGIARDRTRSVAVPIVMHAAFNAANVGLAFAVI
ncbi:MAG: type II CAAX endopeptidase family protein [Planctomycetota bacterium]